MSTHHARRRIVGSMCFLLLIISIVMGCILVRLGTAIFQGARLQAEAPFLNPPADLAEEDLFGVWQVKYGEWGIDTITLDPDSTFKQEYRGNYIDNGNFKFEGSGNPWRIERLSDGRIYLRLQGGRYFPDGVAWSQSVDQGYHFCPEGPPPCSDGIALPIYLYDWIGKEPVNASGELILNIRTTRAGEILLLHLWGSSDRGFPLIGGESEIFRRIPKP